MGFAIFIILFLFMFGVCGLVGLIIYLPQLILQLGGNMFMAIGLILLILIFSVFMGIMMSSMEKDGGFFKMLYFVTGVLMLPSIFGLFFTVPQFINQNSARENITFVGKITDVNNEWLNDRLLIIYLKNVEIGRAISATGKSGFYDVVTDGFFSVTTPNTYEIKAIEMTMDKIPLPIGYDFQSMYLSLGEQKEGFTKELLIPSRKITYAIKVLDGDINSLPPEILQPGSTGLGDDGQIIVALPGSVSADGTQTSGIFVQDISYATKTEQTVTNKLTVPINNCAGSVDVSQKYSQSQTFVHQYTGEVGLSVGVEIPLPLWVKLLPEVQAKYGFENGQIDARTVEYNMAAAPGTNVAYIVTWREIWESGAANITVGTDKIVVPFRVKTNLIYDIASEPKACQ